MSPALSGIFVYVLIQLSVVFFVARRRRRLSETDYLLASRRLGPGLATFTIFATWFGAETCIGAAGEVYQGGLSHSTADPFGYTLCLLLMGLLFAVPLWRRKLTTLADFYRQRYSPGVERFAALLLVPTSIMWAAAQVRALGQVVSASSDIDVELAIAIAAGAVVLYTVYGGMMADAITDVMQGVVLMIGLAMLLICVVIAAGGVGTAIASIDPQRLHLFAGFEASPFEVIERWAVPIAGSLLAQELVAAILASRSAQIARRAALTGGVIYFVFGMIPVIIGLIGLRLIPNLADPEQFLPTIAQRYLSPVLYVIFAGAIVSAILSTVASALLAAAALTEHNLIARLIPDIDAAARVRIARGCVLVSGVVAYVLALHTESVYELVEQASAFGSAGVFTAGVIGLFSRFGGVSAAYATLIVGAVTWVFGQYVLGLSFPYLVSLVAAVFAYVGVGLFEIRRGACVTDGTRSERPKNLSFLISFAENNVQNLSVEFLSCYGSASISAGPKPKVS